MNMMLSKSEIIVLEAKVFDGDWQSRRFASKEWIVKKWEGGLICKPEVYQDIQLLCKKWNDEIVIMTDVEPIPPHQYTKIVKADYIDFDDAAHSMLAQFECHAFGYSGRWGLIADPDNFICYLGSYPG